MKTIFKKFKIVLLLVTFSLNLGVVFAFADTAPAVTNSNHLADSFSITQAMKRFTQGISDTLDGNVATGTATNSSTTDINTDVNFDSTSTVATDTDATTSVDDSSDSCDHFDNIMINVLNLQGASSDTRKKIQNVENTINSETTLRDTILSSVKDFFGLQQKDKIVFKQMKKDIAMAKVYYDNVDLQLDQTQKFLDENDCENVAVTDASKVDSDTQNLVDKEAIFRKQFVANLKSKVKILQDSVKSAKK